MWTGCASFGRDWPWELHSRRRLRVRPSSRRSPARSGNVHLLGALARQVEHRGQYAGVGALALQQCAEDRPHDMGDLAQELTRLRRRLRAGELEDDRQVVGQFSRRKAAGRRARRSAPGRPSPGPRSRLSPCTCSNRCSAVRRPRSKSSTYSASVRSGAVAERAGSTSASSSASRPESSAASARSASAQLRQQRAHLGVGVAQQPGQRAQRMRHLRWGRVEGLHRHTVALIGIVRFFSLPKRLVSETPSLQPLPNEKPQPPRTLNAFSAYSRCVVGITKRSS